MFDASAIQDELEDLKQELRRLLAGTERRWLPPSRSAL
jgi:hypothetical protein